ncbi:hypothetical protein ACFQ0H_12010 [Lysobacter gummosus]
MGTKGIGPEGPPTKVAEGPHDFCGRAFSPDALWEGLQARCFSLRSQ